MRRSTAAAVGTLTGAALIVGVRLSVSTPLVTAAPPAVDLNAGASPNPTGSKAPARKGKAADPAQQKTANEAGGAAGAGGGLKDGVYKGKSSDYAYGAIQVSIKVDGGKITAADATYPINGESATINPNAIAKLKRETLTAKTADDLNAVSGATLTTASYKESLQAALDAAGA